MTQRGILLSIKPQYADLILSGEKTAELRRVRPDLESGDMVILYASSPVSAIVGAFTVQDVREDEVETLWQAVGSQSFVSKPEFSSYFSGKDAGIAILIQDAAEISPQISLDKLRRFYDGFHPPQGYRYLRSLEDAGQSLLCNLDELLARPSHADDNPKDASEKRDIFWKGTAPDFDFDAGTWLAKVVAELADALGVLGAVEVRGEEICVTGEAFQLAMELWLSPFPGEYQVEAIIVWELEGEGVDGQTDVQPDDPMEWVGEHVLEEVRWGLSELEDK
jgi:predicted transcriptional regulator